MVLLTDVKYSFEERVQHAGWDEHINGIQDRAHANQCRIHTLQP